MMNNMEELERALEYPWKKWSIFLHPVQRQLVESERGRRKDMGAALLHYTQRVRNSPQLSPYLFVI
jgi:hypothetical protein